VRLSIKELRPFRDDIAGMFRFAQRLGCAAVQVHLPDDARLEQIRAAMRETGLAVASVGAMSCDMLGPDPARMLHEHRQVELALAVASELGAPTISQFAGHDTGQDLAANAATFARLYLPHARVAARLGLGIAFENCPMFGGRPVHARNLAYCPAHWQALFDALPHPALGLELDVSHLPYVGIDPVAAIRAWGPRLRHVQIKDVRLDRTRQAEAGCATGIPHGFCPLGSGELDGPAIIAALRAVGYQGSGPRIPRNGR
jgi:sugar phosphate isomerase/epimerase